MYKDFLGFAYDVGEMSYLIMMFARATLATLLVIAERAGVTMPWVAPADRGTGGMHDAQVRSSSLSGDGGEFEWSATVRERARQLDSFMAR